MSIRLEMLQVARLAPKVLGPEATGLVAKFLRTQQNEDGGFKDRKGQSDLYYTVFGLDALTALQQQFDAERVRSFATSFGDGAGLDFVHLCALARCWAAIRRETLPDVSPTETLRQRLAAFRSRDGGFNATPNGARGTAYGAFLGVAAYQDLQATLPEPMELVRSLKFLETEARGPTKFSVAVRCPLALPTRQRRP
jgi:hypothetical protein